MRLPWQKGDEPSAVPRERPLRMLDSDAPISTADDDRLGRRTFAALLARQVELAPSTGFVIALVGPWGSGKTSVLRMVEQQLTQAQPAGEPARVVISFNPWLVSGSQHLVSQFFSELAIALPQALGRNRGTNAAERLRRYSAGLRALERAPGVGWVVGVGGAALDEAGRQIDRAPKSIYEERTETRNALSELDAHIVVLIDDVDRLEDSEIRDLMRMIKLLGDFPNVTYLLAFVRDAVRSALTAGSTDGGEYLEKIVQIEYRLPEPPAEMLEAVLVDSIDRAIGDVPAHRLDPHRWEPIYREIVRPLVSRPRHARRFANTLPLALALVGEEVDIADVIGLTALHTLLPAFHDGLIALRDDLTPPPARPVPGRDQGEGQASAERLRQAAAESGNPAVAHATYKLLFPASLGVLSNTYFEDPMGWKRARQVADREAFDTYFTASLPQAALSVAEVRDTIEAFAAGPDALSAVLAAHPDETLPALFQRVWAHVEELDLQDIEASLPVLDAVAARLAHLQSGLWSPADRVRLFIRDLVARFPMGDERDAVVRRRVEQSETLMAKFEWLRLIGAWAEGTQPLCSVETMAALRAELATAVLASAPPDLLREERPGWLLRVAEDDGGDDASRRIGELIEDGKLLPAYLSAFMTLTAAGNSALQVSEVEERQGRARLEPALMRIDASQLDDLQRDASGQLAEHYAAARRTRLEQSSKRGTGTGEPPST